MADPSPEGETAPEQDLDGVQGRLAVAVEAPARLGRAGATPPPARGGPALSRLARAARARAGTALFFLGPLGIMASYSVAEREGFTGRRLRLLARELPLPLGPALRRGLPAHARPGRLRDGGDAPRRLPVRLLPRPLRAAQDAAAPARHHPVLDELPDPHVRLADHPRPRLPALPLASIAASPPRLQPPVTPRRSTSASSTTTCR